MHGDWKSIQLPVPADREMVSVFRGSRPRQRVGRYVNFDTFLLHLAADEGAEVMTAEATDVRYSTEGKPLVSYRTVLEEGSDLPDKTLEADFAVFAGGVNRSSGMDPRSDPLFGALQQMIPELRPPRVRRAVIAELTAGEGELRSLEGELHFMQYGSKDLHIEMASLMPKQGWATAVLVGRSVDRAAPGDSLEVVKRFVAVAAHPAPAPARGRSRAAVLVPAEHDHRGGQAPLRRPDGAHRGRRRGPALQGRPLLGATRRRRRWRTASSTRGSTRPAWPGATTGGAGLRHRQPLRPRDLPAQPLGLLAPQPEPGALPGRPQRTQEHPARQAPVGARALAEWQVATTTYRRTLRENAVSGLALADPDGRPS